MRILCLVLWLMGAALAQEAAQLLYLDTADLPRIARAWRAWVQRNSRVRGPAVLGPSARGWTPLAVEALARLAPEEAGAAARELSTDLGGGVLLLITTAERAWYFYCQGGQALDRYCSNPGLPGEVSADVLRGWAGRPEVLLPVCRGRPLSATREQVSLTDLNALLYFYYPEMRLKKPAAWRSPGDFLQALSQVLGTSPVPAPFTHLAGLPGWRLLR